MDDAVYQNRAVELAKQGQGTTRTNPMVGACLVSDGEIIAEGTHETFGGNHAEENLLSKLEDIPEDSVLHLTLEPCIRHGKTPPCLQKLAESGIRNYVILSRDPNPSVNGAGIDALRRLGYSVDVIGGSDEYHWLNRHYYHGIRTGLPWVDLKLAMSADGYLATAGGNSQWITGDASRDFGHRLRSRVDAVMVGAGTVRSDDPRLTDRVTGTDNQPLAVVVARSARGLDPSLRLFTERPDETILVVPPSFSDERMETLRDQGIRVIVSDLYQGEFDWRQVLRQLRRETIGRILVEGGSMLAGSLIQAGHVNECHLFYSGKIFGNGIPSVGSSTGVQLVDEAPDGRLIEHDRFDNDLYARRFLAENTSAAELRGMDFDTLEDVSAEEPPE